jgi:hypothetical protein
MTNIVEAHDKRQFAKGQNCRDLQVGSAVSEQPIDGGYFPAIRNRMSGFINNI